MSDSPATKPLLIVPVVLGVAILLAVTNPSAEQHRNALEAGADRGGRWADSESLEMKSQEPDIA